MKKRQKVAARHDNILSKYEKEAEKSIPLTVLHFTEITKTLIFCSNPKKRQNVMARCIEILSKYEKQTKKKYN